MDYDKLYKTAFEFKKVKLWNRVHDSEIFAVKLSNDRIGYITITGSAGQVYMLSVYIGEDAVQGLLKMIFETPVFFSKFEEHEMLFTQDCLQCAFEDKDYIGEEEAEIVKKYARKHRIKLSGAHAYPFFWKYSPYRVPGKITSEDDAVDLLEAVLAAMELAKRLESGESKEKLGLKDVNKRTKKIIMFERNDSGYKISKTDFPKRKPPKIPVPECKNEIAFARLKNFENKIDLECEIVRQIMPMSDENGSGDVGFPVILYAINAKSYFVLPIEPVLFYEDNPDKLMDSFLNVLSKFEICPTAIKAVNKQTYEFFKPFGEKLGINVEFAHDHSEVMEDFQEKLEEEIYGEDDDFDENEDLTEEQLEQLNELLNGLLGVGQGKMGKDELIDLLGSLGIGLPEDAASAIRAEKENDNNSKTPDNVISLDSMRKKQKSSGADTAYVLSVSVYKGCYRHIKVSGDTTLWDLHLDINSAFDFEDDHLHAFFMDNKAWSPRKAYYDERAEEPGYYTSSDVTVDDMKMSVGDQFKYLFDFGDEWIFQCKVLKKLNEPNVQNRVIKSVGESPEQYPEYEESDWDGEDDEFEVIDPENFRQ